MSCHDNEIGDPGRARAGYLDQPEAPPPSPSLCRRVLCSHALSLRLVTDKQTRAGAAKMGNEQKVNKRRCIINWKHTAGLSEKPGEERPAGAPCATAACCCRQMD
jgi:hypothetical protein